MVGQGNSSREYGSKVIGAEAAAALLHNGDSIVLSGGSMQPQAFLAAVSARRDLRRITISTWRTLAPPDLLVRQFVGRNRGENPERQITLCSFAVGPGELQAAQAGLVEVVAANAASLGSLLRRRRIDLLVVGSSGMDEEGNFNLGGSVDWMPDLLAAADQSDTIVIVEVNRTLPVTEGETSFRLESVDYVIEADRPPLELVMGRSMAEARAVGGYLAGLVPDGATLQLGPGDLVSQAAAALDCKRDLGVHSELICDVMLHLHDRQALTCRKKGYMDGRWVGSHVLGSRRLYDFVNRNPMISLHPTDVVVQAGAIVRNHAMVSITQAVQVDLTGQVAGQRHHWEAAINPGVQRLFHSQAAMVPGGAGIVILPAAPGDGSSSNIVSQLDSGAIVAIPADDVDCVVTEEGVARLRGRSVRERTLELISIARPERRDELAFRARKLGLL